MRDKNMTIRELSRESTEDIKLKYKSKLSKTDIDDITENHYVMDEYDTLYYMTAFPHRSIMNFSCANGIIVWNDGSIVRGNTLYDLFGNYDYDGPKDIKNTSRIIS